MLSTLGAVTLLPKSPPSVTKFWVVLPVPPWSMGNASVRWVFVTVTSVAVPLMSPDRWTMPGALVVASLTEPEETVAATHSPLT